MVYVYVLRDRRSLELCVQKFATSPVRDGCRRCIVVRHTMPSEGVMLTRIAVDSRVCFSCQGRFDLGLRRLRDKLVLLGQVHEQPGLEFANLRQVFFPLAAMVSNRSGDFRTGGCEKEHSAVQDTS